MKYYIIAGEASGDLHGSNLIEALKTLDNNVDIRCWGGDKMEATGAVLVKHYKELAFMGFSEVLKNLPAIFRNFKFCKKDIASFAPDVVVLIDYPGFNLRMAKWAKMNQYKTIFYISPQVWAWKENRVKAIKRFVDKMIVILPFEKDFYKKWNYEVDYVGHPLVEVVDDYTDKHPFLIPNSDIIALLPGSRKQEIIAKLPVMLEAAKNFKDYTFIIAKAPSIEDEFYEDFIKGHENVKTVVNSTYSLLMQCTAAIVTSGTATLETALFNVPQVVCYKAGSISYEIAKRLVKLKYICLVNLIMDKSIVAELIQDELTPANITLELNKILTEKDRREEIESGYHQLRLLLTEGGNASLNAAKIIHAYVNARLII